MITIYIIKEATTAVLSCQLCNIVEYLILQNAINDKCKHYDIRPDIIMLKFAL